MAFVRLIRSLYGSLFDQISQHEVVETGKTYCSIVASKAGNARAMLDFERDTLSGASRTAFVTVEE
jgi:hypothetical protein